MVDITASMVKELRQKTGAGMMDCKKALAENNGDIEAAIDWLRTKGIASAEKKSGRVAAEGLVAVKTGGTKGIIIELNAETDFVARNENFQGFLNSVADIALENGTENIQDQDLNGKTVADSLTELIANIGENMTLRRADELSVTNGTVTSYIHNAEADGLGKIGVLVALESAADAAKLDEIGKKVAMHIAATNPQSLDTDSLDPELVDRERQVLIDQAKESGKPDNIIEKMVDGRMRKYYQEVVLLEQAFVMDTEKSVGQFVADQGKELGSDIKMTGFIRFELGEGVEKKDEDFAAEVASAIAG